MIVSNTKMCSRKRKRRELTNNTGGGENYEISKYNFTL